MCLRTEEKKLKVAPGDITCWKMLLRRQHFTVTPYMECYVPSSVLSGEKPFEAPGGTCYCYNGVYIYDVGFIHTYADKSSVTSIAMDNGYDVYECIIPAGTRYIDGVDIVGDRCFASEQIVFVRKVE